MWIICILSAFSRDSCSLLSSSWISATIWCPCPGLNTGGSREEEMDGGRTTTRQYSEYSKKIQQHNEKTIGTISGISHRMDQITRCLVVTFRRATMIGLRRKNILIYLHPDDHMMDMWQKDYVLQLDNWRKQWSGCSRT